MTMKQIWTRRRLGSAVATLALIAGIVAVREGVGKAYTSIVPYAVALGDEYEITPLFSVGDTVRETSDRSKRYQMVGIPDGLGAHANRNGTITVYSNHELVNTSMSEPVLGEPLNRGALVTKYLLDRYGNVLTAERAYDTVYMDDTLVGPAAAVGNTTRGFGRFCSGALAGPEQGFDRYIYFANEEGAATANTPSPVTNSPTLDPKGGLSVAIFDNQAHGLTDLGRFPWENTLVQPGTGRLTVIMGMEDGPAALNPAVENSQIYMYVGEKSRRWGATALERNGLVGGTLYVFKSTTPGMNSEQPFQNGTINGTWVAIPGADLMDQAQLDLASDAAGAMTFGRPEDGAFNPRNKNEYFFVTTGQAAGANVLGRLYSLRLNKFNPTGPAQLEVLYNADQIIAAGGDTAISPDNVDVSEDYLMINEDGTAESRLVMTAKHRDGSIWRFKLTGHLGVDVDSRERVASLDPPGRDGVAVGAGVWETTGIIDVSGMFGFNPLGFRHWFGSGREAWLFNVQAHAPTAAPQPNTVEDGQLLLMTRNPKHEFPWFWWWDDHHGDDGDDDDDDHHD